MNLLPVAEAQARLLALAVPLPGESVPLAEAVGRWASAPIIAARTQPFADLSAMDGYAIRFGDMPGPWTVIGESPAGAPIPPPLPATAAMRIFTGAPLPPGADAILIQEEATREEESLHLSGDGPARPGTFVRSRGADFNKGNILIPPGTQLSAAHIGLAALAGLATMSVHRPARIALISTGNELVPAGDPAEGHQLPSSNAPMLAALLGGPSARITDLGIARDRIEDITALIEAARDADLIITSGGASVGDHDLVKPAFEASGAQLDFWKVAMRPGKPLMAGRLGNAIVLGLPGNPVSAFVTALIFARPLIAVLGGSHAPMPRSRMATLADPLPANGPRTHYMRGRWHNGCVVVDEDQDSAGLRRLTEAMLLVVRPAGAPAIAAGEPVEILDIA